MPDNLIPNPAYLPLTSGELDLREQVYKKKEIFSIKFFIK